MRRRENVLNTTVDLRIQEKSYTNHIMTLRRIKPSIETTQPETPLHFSLHQDSWEKNREENIERSNLLQSRTQFSKVKSYNDQNNKSVSFSGITARSQSNRPSTSYSTPKTYNRSSSKLQNNFHISESQVFLTQTNVRSKPKPKAKNKTKIDVFLSKTPPNQWKQISETEENENNDAHNIQAEPKRKKIERSPYRPAAQKVLKMQKIVSNQFNKRYLRTELALRKSSNMNSDLNFETDSECVANITDDNLTSENSILKNTSSILRASTRRNIKEVNKNEENKIEDDIDDDFEKFDDEKDTSDELQNENINSENNKDNDSSDSHTTDDHSKYNENSNDGESKDLASEPKKKRKKVIRKKIRKVRVIHQPKNDVDDDLHEITLSDD